MVIFAVLLQRAIKTASQEEVPPPNPKRWMLVFSAMLFVLAFYDALYLRPDGAHRMLCFVFVAVGALFYVSPLTNLGFLGAVLAIFLGLTYCVKGGAICTIEEIAVVLAALLGFFLGWQRSHGSIVALQTLERESAGKVRAEEARTIISQLQPHFLYNALSSIQYLCKSDQDRAQVALGQFCRVMRGNMDAAVNRTAKIPFQWELEHTQNYIALEQLRFGHRLIVRYHIEAEDFLIPALALQSVVENAIKHGVCDQKDGGVLIISSKLAGKWVEVTVTDGSSVAEAKNFRRQDRWADSPNHVGLQTIRSRIQAVMEGDLTLRSIEEVGSVVTIRILKEEVSKLC